MFAPMVFNADRQIAMISHAGSPRGSRPQLNNVDNLIPAPPPQNFIHLDHLIGGWELELNH